MYLEIPVVLENAVFHLFSATLLAAQGCIRVCRQELQEKKR